MLSQALFIIDGNFLPGEIVNIWHTLMTRIGKRAPGEGWKATVAGRWTRYDPIEVAFSGVRRNDFAIYDSIWSGVKFIEICPGSQSLSYVFLFVGD